MRGAGEVAGALALLAFAVVVATPVEAQAPVIGPGRESEVVALFAPHAMGAEVADGWTLSGITIEARAVTAALTRGEQRASVALHPTGAPGVEATAASASFELEERGADLAAWRTRAGVGAEEYIEAAAGDALLFDPNLLHKAVPPEQGRRDVMTFLVMPSALPWNEALARQGLDRIQRDPGGYPPTPEI